MELTHAIIEPFAGTKVRLTMIDGVIFEGTLWFVEYGEPHTDEDKTPVVGVNLDTYEFGFQSVHIEKIESLD